VIGRSHSELGRALWSDPVCRGFDQSQAHTAFSSDEMRSDEMRWDEWCASGLLTDTLEVRWSFAEELSVEPSWVDKLCGGQRNAGDSNCTANTQPTPCTAHQSFASSSRNSFTLLLLIVVTSERSR